MKYLICVLVAAVYLFQVNGTVPNNCSCAANECFSVIQESVDFQKALKKCKERNGHLAEVRFAYASEAISYLLENTKGDFWIGLQYTDKKCTDMLTKLKGYKWTEGDNTTEFTNWKSKDKVCSPMCVSISNDLKWTERSCDDKLNGYVCGNIGANVCGPLATESDNIVLYNITVTDAKELCSVSPGSIALSVPSKVKHVCSNENQWVRAPWGCDFANGGCDFECKAYNGKSRCLCAAGTALQSNDISCAGQFQDPCLSLQCEHICISGTACDCRQGYMLDDDGRGCRDIDECADPRQCTNGMKCYNTNGSFRCECPTGFRKEGNKCVDINECVSGPCEHNCTNTPGSYSCQCYDGYALDPKDMTKCVLHCPTAECRAECDPNNPQQCNCPEGYVSDDRAENGIFCVDIDECESNFCEHLCENTYGSYMCSCRNGFYLDEKSTCVQAPTDDDDVTTTPTQPPPHTVSSGGLFGITFCVALVILLLLLLFYLKRHSKWIFRGMNANQNEDMKDLQEVTAETARPFPSSQIKSDTC